MEDHGRFKLTKLTMTKSVPLELLPKVPQWLLWLTSFLDAQCRYSMVFHGGTGPPIEMFLGSQRRAQTLAAGMPFYGWYAVCGAQ